MVFDESIDRLDKIAAYRNNDGPLLVVVVVPGNNCQETLKNVKNFR